MARFQFPIPLWWPGAEQARKEAQESDRGRPRGTGHGQQVVREILKEKGTLSTREVAREYHLRRDGPHIPFQGKARAAAEGTVGQILRSLRRDQEVVHKPRGDSPDRRRSFWTYVDPDSGVQYTEEGPRGSDKPTGWTGSHAKAGSVGGIKPAERHEPAHPVDLAEQNRRRDQRKRRADRTNPENWGANAGRDDMAPESQRNKDARSRAQDPLNPENWGKNKPQSKGKGRTGDPSTWGAAAEKGKSGRTGDPSTWGHAAEKNKSDDDDNGNDDKGSGFLKPSF